MILDVGEDVKELGLSTTASGTTALEKCLAVSEKVQQGLSWLSSG